jgi:hypothetical protein
MSRAGKFAMRVSKRKDRGYQEANVDAVGRRFNLRVGS